MLQFFAQNGFGVITVLVFVAALLLMEALYLFWRSAKGPQARKLSRRMQALATDGGSSSPVRVLKGATLSKLPGLERWLSSMPRLQGTKGYLVQADVRWTVAQLMLASALLGVVGIAAATRLPVQGLLVSLGLGSAFAAAPWAYVSAKRARRLARIERQLPDALDFLTRALRSGQAFTSALLIAGEELPEPLAGEFRAAHDEITFGVSLEQALTNLSERIPITDIRYFVVSVVIQRESGGNLTEVLGNLSRLIRERYKLMAKVRVLAADGLLSGWILVMAPFALAAMMQLTNPKFMSLMWTDPMGITMIKVLLVMMVVGIIIMRRIVKIRV